MDIKTTKLSIAGIPAIIWGEESHKVYLCVHGKMSCKESAEGLAKLAAERGYQTIAFDLPQHGERQKEEARCDVWNGMHDLTLMADYAFSRWQEVALYACSLGAYFSLQAYPQRGFSKCLFQSPILDMEYLIRQMFLWFDISEKRLADEKEIDTPIDLMRWDYYQYVLAHPVKAWGIPTSILYGSLDDLQSRRVMEDFTRRFGCELNVSEGSKHPFMEAADFPVVDQWLKEHL